MAARRGQHTEETLKKKKKPGQFCVPLQDIGYKVQDKITNRAVLERVCFSSSFND